jgi:O-methyltransferase involved in polyketide biosynthesis
MYLSGQGVDNTLAFITNHSGPGSAVIFDYFHNETLRDPSRPEVKMMQRTARVTSEGVLFGIDQGQIESFLTQRGYREVCNTTPKDLKRLYFTGPNAGRMLPSGCDIVSVRVNKAAD